MNYNKIYFAIRKTLVYITLSIFCLVILWLLFYYIFITDKISTIKNVFSLNVENNLKPFIISGISEKGLSYYITSEKSSNYVQNILNKENILLKKPYLKLILPNGTEIISKSEKGIIDNLSKIFLMRENVRFVETKKKFIETQFVTIDLQNKTLTSKEPTFGLYENISLNSQGFFIDPNKSYINILGAYTIQTIRNKPLKISAKGNLSLDFFNKIISTSDDFDLQTLNLTIKADQAKIWYINFKNIAYNLQNNSYENFKRIELDDNVIIQSKDSTLTADQYVNDTAKNIMILRSKNNLVKYESPKLILTSNERFEYMYKDQLLVARGKPVFYIKNSSGSGEIDYQISQNLVSASINNSNKVVKVEAFDNITIKYKDTIIKADYLTYNADSSTIIAEDNISLTEDNKSLTGCRLVINLKNNITRLIPCTSQDKLTVTNNTK